jgi:twitching motility protein PilT
MIDKINKERRGHILTIEDPIEFVHRHQGCMVNQREVGADTKTFSQALKYALRQDPGRDPGGRDARPGDDPGRAHHRRDRAPLPGDAAHQLRGGEHQPHHRRLPLAPAVAGPGAARLRAGGGGHADAAPQALRGGGRVCACEIMVCTPAVRACIRDDKVHQIYSILQAGKKHGMQTLNDSLYQLYMQREVALEDCVRASPIPPSSCGWSASRCRRDRGTA